MEASNEAMTGFPDDRALVNACRSGRTDAFGLLVRRYQDRLFATLSRILGSQEEARDVLQDAFIRAFEKLDQFQGESSFYTWIHRIGVNLALSKQRSRRNQPSARSITAGPVGDNPSLEPVDESPEANPSHQVEQVERREIIEAALNELAPEQRNVVILKDFDGRRYEEISDLLGIPIGTVRSRLHRARAELRVKLRSLIDDERSYPHVEQPLGKSLNPD